MALTLRPGSHVRVVRDSFEGQKREVEINPYDIIVEVDSLDTVYDKIEQNEDINLESSPIWVYSAGNVIVKIDEDLMSARDSNESDVAITKPNFTNVEVLGRV